MANRGTLVDPTQDSGALSRHRSTTPEPRDRSTEATSAPPRAGHSARTSVTEGDWTDVTENRVGTGKLIMLGFLVVLAFFGAGLLWAGLAPLSSAAIAPGVVSVAGNRKTVQHLEGGIVKEIHVREGDAVAADQVLIQLDDTQARTTLELIRAQYISALLEEARLTTELADQPTMKFSFDARQPESETARQILQDQLDIFATDERRWKTRPTS